MEPSRFYRCEGAKMTRLYVVILLVTIFSSFISASHQLDLFNFGSYSPKCEKNKGHSVAELIRQSLRFSIESRTELQNLYQARAAIRVSMGQILPQLDPSSALAAGIDLSASIDTILPLVGSIFPNRWYTFKASYILRKAEKFIAHSVLADRAQVIQDIYYNIQTQIWSIRVLKFYENQIGELIHYLTATRKYKNLKRDLALLENMKAKISYDRAFIDALSASLPQLATEVGLNPSVDWAHLALEECDIASLKKEIPGKYFDYWPQALERSPEVKYAFQLIRAARATKFATYLDILDLGNGSTINFGTFSMYKSERSNVQICELGLKQAEMQLSNSIQNALNNYNDAIEAIPPMEDAVVKLEDIRRTITKNINDKKSVIDINNILWYFEYAEGQALRLVTGYFSFKIAQADLDRYTWNGPIYKMVQDYIDFELPQRLIEIRRANSVPFHLAQRLKIDKYFYKNYTPPEQEPDESIIKQSDISEQEE